MEKNGIKIFRCNALSNEFSTFKSKTAHPIDFRNGFWFKTIARFFAIKQFMKVYPESILQIEADVWISKEFPFKSFEMISGEIAYTMETGLTGSAAILWIKNFESSSKLCAITEQMIESDPNTTDMRILGEIALEKKMEVTFLPTNPESNSSHENGNFSNYLFDPLSYGIYFLGEDPKNHRGVRKYGQTYENHLLKPSALKIYFNEANQIKISSLESFKDFTLVNLHNHSKDLRVFKTNSSQKLLKIKINSFRKRNEIVFPIFIRLSIYYVYKKIKILFIRNIYPGNGVH